MATGLKLVQIGYGTKAAIDSIDAIKTAINNNDSVGLAKAIMSLGAAINDIFTGGCFAAGTPILTPEGSKFIEDIRPGDWVITAPDDDPDAEPVPRQVEATFENYLPLLDLYVNGRTIRTTAEHPFWVRDGGWVAAHQLEAGDELRTHDGGWLKVGGLEGPKPSAPVYNMCVAEYHTYFIGDQIWGFAIWAHNKPTGVVCGEGDAPKSLKEMSAAERRAHFLGKGVPATQIGPSGYPKVHIVETSTLKEAEEAARLAGKGKPLLHNQDRGQPPHFHPVDEQGKKLSGGDNIHFQRRGGKPNPE